MILKTGLTGAIWETAQRLSGMAENGQSARR